MIKKSLLLIALIFCSVLLAANPLLAEEGFVYDSKDKRDPFVPLITMRTRFSSGLEDVETADDIILQGIVWDPRGGSMAMLNGVIVKEGQVIGVINIKSIKEKNITLLFDGIEHKIDLIKKGDEAGGEE